MERFSQLLLESSEPIADIAMSVGLSDYKNLARQFKLWKNIHPLNIERFTGEIEGKSLISSFSNPFLRIYRLPESILLPEV